MRLGVNITLDPNRAAVDCAAAAKLGAKVVRTSQEQGWGSVDARLGPFRKACDDNGLELMQCAQTAGHVQPTSQHDLDAYGEFVAECAEMADQTSSGNEINGFGSRERPDPRKAAVTTAAVIDARDRLAPKRVLLMPSMCPASGPIGSTYVEPLVFLSAMVAAEPRIARAMRVDWHGYCDGRYDPSTRQTWNQCWRTRAVQQWLATIGSPHRRIIWSEWGTATGPAGWPQRISTATQVLRFNQQIAEAHSQVDAGVHLTDLVWYCLRDRNAVGPDDWPAFAGLLDIRGNEKPVAGAFRAAAASLA